MANRLGGETPIIKYGSELTFESMSTVSATAPINQGEIFKIDGTATDGTAYKLAECAAGDNPAEVTMVMALHRCQDPNQLVGGKLLNGSEVQVRRLKYDGAAPSLGNSIEAAAGNVRKVTGIAYAKGAGRVMAVNTATTEVEVLI